MSSGAGNESFRPFSFLGPPAIFLPLFCLQESLLMHLPEFLIGAFVYLAAAVVAAPIASRLGLGSVLGYLVAGILIGPAVLGLVGSEGQDVLHFAEFGVIMMLFLVGLELQPSKLWSLRKPILGLGGLQVLGTSASIALAAYIIGLDGKAAVATGL